MPRALVWLLLGAAACTSPAPARPVAAPDAAAAPGGTTYWSPVEAQRMIRPSVSFERTCGGVCSAANVARVLAGLVESVKSSAARPNYNTGDPRLDAMRMDVTVLEACKSTAP